VTKLKANCEGKAKCACGDGIKSRSFRVRLMPSETRRHQWRGKEILIVPVVMARADVVMNGSLFPEEEMLPETWDGVPVTVGHPSNGGEFVSANSPEVLSEWAVGQIFHSNVVDGKLKGEAWITIDLAEKIAPGMIETIESGEPMDVSTGYFSFPELIGGELNGKVYEDIDRGVRPNHLALLPHEEGACNWADGCGVRANKRRYSVNIDKAVDALKLALNQAIKAKGQSKAPAKKKNERGEDDDRRQIMADLISHEASPFLPDDEESLRSMTDETLKKMRDQYITRAEGDEVEEPEAAEEETEEEAPVENEGEEGDEEEEAAPAAQKKGKVMTKAAPKKPVLATFSKEDRAALLHARKLVDARKAELIEKITGNSAITKDQASAMDIATLEVVAAGIRPEANYSGRAMPVNAEEATDAGKAMVAPSVSDMIVNRNKKGA
jgi:hypothetical protein